MVYRHKSSFRISCLTVLEVFHLTIGQHLAIRICSRQRIPDVIVRRIESLRQRNHRSVFGIGYWISRLDLIASECKCNSWSIRISHLRLITPLRFKAINACGLCENVIKPCRFVIIANTHPYHNLLDDILVIPIIGSDAFYNLVNCFINIACIACVCIV